AADLELEMSTPDQHIYNRLYCLDANIIVSHLNAGIQERDMTFADAVASYLIGTAKEFPLTICPPHVDEIEAYLARHRTLRNHDQASAAVLARVHALSRSGRLFPWHDGGPVLGLSTLRESIFRQMRDRWASDRGDLTEFHRSNAQCDADAIARVI